MAKCRYCWCVPAAVAFCALGLQGCGSSSSTTPAPPTPTPAPTPTPTPAPAPRKDHPCVCIFDVDRTLTGSQDDTKNCPDNTVIQGVKDDAYRGGTLTFSEAFTKLNDTFCVQKKCYLGIVSVGTAGGAGSKERSTILDYLSRGGGIVPSQEWTGPGAKSPTIKSCQNVPVTSSLVLGCKSGTKHFAVQSIIAWLETKENVVIWNKDVYMFDDKEGNIAPFQGTGFNAVEVSCKTREPKLGAGLCGAQLAEIVEGKGVNLCAKPDNTVVV